MGPFQKNAKVALSDPCMKFKLFLSQTIFLKCISNQKLCAAIQGLKKNSIVKFSSANGLNYFFLGRNPLKQQDNVIKQFGEVKNFLKQILGLRIEKK